MHFSATSRIISRPGSLARTIGTNGRRRPEPGPAGTVYRLLLFRQHRETDGTIIGERTGAADLEIPPVDRETSFKDIIFPHRRGDKRKGDVLRFIPDGKLSVKGIMTAVIWPGHRGRDHADTRVFLHVEIRFFLQMTIPHAVIGIYRSGVDTDVEGGLVHIPGIKADLPVEPGECPF